MRAFTTLLCLLSGLAAARGPAPETDAVPDTWTTDTSGRPFRQAFDLGTRLYFGGGWAADLDHADRGQVELGIRARRTVEAPADGVIWKLEHEVLTGVALLSGEGSLSAPLVHASLYRGRFMRWSREGFLSLPTSPPRRIPFPLDLGVELTVGRLDTFAADSALALSADLGVLRAELLFDLWRSPRQGSYAAFGIGPSYDLRFTGPLDAEPTLSHVVTPFSAASVAVRYETPSGRQVVSARLEGSYAWASATSAGEGRWAPQAGASASYEAVLIALNDWPLSAVLSVDYRYDGLVEPSDAQRLMATAGLRFGPPLD